jgi:hypothetical protein
MAECACAFPPYTPAAGQLGHQIQLIAVFMILILPDSYDRASSRSRPDEALTVNDEARDRIIKNIIIDHWSENGGRVPAFGGITGYVLVLVAGYGGFDIGLPFSITGDRAGAMQKVERLGEATLGTRRGDTRLTGLLKNSPIRIIQVGEGE